MTAGGMLRTLGGDNGGKITREDWEKTFERLSKGKGFITPEDLRGADVPAAAAAAGRAPGRADARGRCSRACSTATSARRSRAGRRRAGRRTSA